MTPVWQDRRFSSMQSSRFHCRSIKPLLQLFHTTESRNLPVLPISKLNDAESASNMRCLWFTIRIAACVQLTMDQPTGWQFAHKLQKCLRFGWLKGRREVERGQGKREVVVAVATCKLQRSANSYHNTLVLGYVATLTRGMMDCR